MCAQRALNRCVWINVGHAICRRQVTTINAAALRVPVSSPLNPREAVIPAVGGDSDYCRREDNGRH